RYYKMKIHDPDPVANRKRVEAVKKAVGDGVRLMVDVNQELDVDAAIRQARAPEDLDLVWYEEPPLAGPPAACAGVAPAVRMPAALPHSFLVEFIDWTPGDLFEGRPKCEGGAFRVPDRPGHGIALGPDAEKKYRLG